MRILICNDDGVDAPGLEKLSEAARLITNDVWTVAPEAKRTAAGSSITIARPITMRQVDAKRYSCSGTPADCVVTAMTWLFYDQPKPDLVLAGINEGRNVAEDLAYSGTLGIAREATFWGIPAIGISRVKQPRHAATDATWVADFIRRALKERSAWVANGHWLSVNLPAELPAPVRQPRIGRDKIGRSAEVVSEEANITTLIVPRGREHSSTEGDENSLIDSGHVCVNRLNWFGESKLDHSFVEKLAS
ncbi:MAG: 5'/3'-nucleotidase SurE [Phyllobacterium sp.]|uniref:5'/3'-nucleotidase SurE n=1 Tax=Phyllobacterium sp. TaxID=1871046 RepID=UPI0030EFCECE